MGTIGWMLALAGTAHAAESGQVLTGVGMGVAGVGVATIAGGVTYMFTCNSFECPLGGIGIATIGAGVVMLSTPLWTAGPWLSHHQNGLRGQPWAGMTSAALLGVGVLSGAAWFGSEGRNPAFFGLAVASGVGALGFGVTQAAINASLLRSAKVSVAPVLGASSGLAVSVRL